MQPVQNLRAAFARAATVCLLTLSVAPAAFAQVTITPTSISGDLTPGQVDTKTVTVSVSNAETDLPVDIYFLADTTGSMGLVLNQLSGNIVNLLSALDGTLTNVRFGAGQYHDFPVDELLPAFVNNQPLTTESMDVANAVQAWAASGGSDTPEGQFYALDRIADPNDPFGIGWRPEARKFLVWFGDAPGHDPVCSALTDFKYDITESSVIAALQSAGIKVVAIGTTTGVSGALNADPDIPDGEFGNDYLPPCESNNGVAGQADRIAEATGGISAQDINPNEVSGVIFNLLAEARGSVNIDLIVKGDLEGRVNVLTAPFNDVVLPISGAPANFTFVVECVGLPCVPALDLHLFEGALCARVDGAEVATIPVTLSQTACDGEDPPGPRELVPFILNQVETVTCDVPYEFEFDCRNLAGTPVRAKPASDPATQVHFDGEIVIDGKSASYTPPPETNGLFRFAYICETTDGQYQSDIGEVAIWVFTCDETQLPQPEDPNDVSNPVGNPIPGGNDCMMGATPMMIMFMALCFGSSRRRFGMRSV